MAFGHHFPRHHLIAACGISLLVAVSLTLLPDNVVAYRAHDGSLPETVAYKNPQQVPEVSVTDEVTTAPIIKTDPWLHLTVQKGDVVQLIAKGKLVLSDIRHYSQRQRCTKTDFAGRMTN